MLATDVAFEYVPPVARVLIAGSLVVLVLVDLVVGWLVGDRSSLFQSSPEDRGSYQVVIVATLAGILLAMSALRRLPNVRLPGSAWIWVTVGLAAAWFGIVLRGWSIAVLGSSFRRVVRVAADQQVVSSGPYRFVRHPSYTGLLLAYAGLGLAVGNPLALGAVVVLPVAGFVYRIFVEERALEASLGEAYASYERGRSRLIPGVW